MLGGGRGCVGVVIGAGILLASSLSHSLSLWWDLCSPTSLGLQLASGDEKREGAPCRVSLQAHFFCVLDRWRETKGAQ